MKAILFALLVALGAQSIYCAGLTQKERDHLVAHLQMTQSWFVDEVSPLSQAQLNFRPAPGKWSVLEVMEHLVIAEPIYWKELQGGMKQPPKAADKKVSDADVLWYGIDRTHHEKTEPRKDPIGKVMDVAQGLDSFRKLHATMLEYAESTDDDLRAHFVPEWGVDAYQCLLGISTHAQRHILQIREIKADSAFPKK
jgi:hypothetical protein